MPAQGGAGYEGQLRTHRPRCPRGGVSQERLDDLRPGSTALQAERNGNRADASEPPFVVNVKIGKWEATVSHFTSYGCLHLWFGRPQDIFRGAASYFVGAESGSAIYRCCSAIKAAGIALAMAACRLFAIPTQRRRHRSSCREALRSVRARIASLAATNVDAGPMGRYPLSVRRAWRTCPTNGSSSTIRMGKEANGSPRRSQTAVGLLSGGRFETKSTIQNALPGRTDNGASRASRDASSGRSLQGQVGPILARFRTAGGRGPCSSVSA